MKHYRAALVVVAFVCALAGCSHEVPGEPNQSQAVPTQGDESGYQVPPIPRRLDISSYLGNPCGLVSDGFMKSSGYAPGGSALTAEDSDLAERYGPGCLWNAVGSGVRAIVTIPVQGGGLGSRYAAYQGGAYAYWEPVELSGYPAAFFDLRDQRPQGTCNIGVGVADDRIFAVTAGSYSDDPEQACEVVAKIAQHVLLALKRNT